MFILVQCLDLEDKLVNTFPLIADMVLQVESNVLLCIIAKYFVSPGDYLQ